MTTAYLDALAARWLLQMDRWAQQREGICADRAREKVDATVAKAAGVAALPLERVRRGRVKGVRGYVLGAIQAAFLAAIEKEKRALEHDLELVGKSHFDLDPAAAGEALAALEAARELIAEARR